MQSHQVFAQPQSARQVVSRVITQLPTHPAYLPSQRTSQASTLNLPPHVQTSSQRVSTVSSNKMSVATRADLIASSTMLNSQTQRSEATMTRNYSSRNIFSPQQSSRNFIIQNIPTFSQASYQMSQQSRMMVHHQSPIPVAYGVPPSTNQLVGYYAPQEQNPYRESLFANTYFNRSSDTTLTMPNLNLNINTPPAQIVTPILPQTARPQQILHTERTEVRSLRKSTVTQGGASLVANVTVQNIQLPPRIREPAGRANRLYKSAVYGRGVHSVSRPLSRAHSTKTFIDKPKKKKDVLIRCPHRSFISDKKIPVIGAYLSKDKSKSYMIRDLSQSHGPKVLTAKVIGTELLEVIPTEVIKIPIGKAEELRQSRYEGSVMDDLHSMSENPIIDQPTLIKHYSPERSIRSYTERRNIHSLDQSFMSNRSRRLGDNIKISVYRSPDVVVKKAETITSGPKLSKHHILRIPVEGKVVSAEKYPNLFKRQSPDSSKKSSSPVARYQETINKYKLESVASRSNPYAKKDVSDILQRLRKERTYTRENIHINSEYSPISTATPNTVSVEPKEQTSEQSIEQKPLVEKEQTAARSYYYCDIGHTQQSIRNIYQEPLNNLFESGFATQQKRESTTSQYIQFHESLRFFSDESKFEKFESTLSMQSLNKHKYQIPQLPQDIEEDLRKLRQQNERKRKETQADWEKDFSRRWGDSILDY